MPGHLSSQQHHDPMGTTIPCPRHPSCHDPRGSMAHMPGLQGHHHPMPRSMVLPTCLVPHSHPGHRLDVAGRRTFRKNLPDTPRSEGRGGTQGAEWFPSVAGTGGRFQGGHSSTAVQVPSCHWHSNGGCPLIGASHEVGAQGVGGETPHPCRGTGVLPAWGMAPSKTQAQPGKKYN